MVSQGLRNRHFVRSQMKMSYESVLVCWHIALVLIAAAKVYLWCEVNVRIWIFCQSLTI